MYKKLNTEHRKKLEALSTSTVSYNVITCILQCKNHYIEILVFKKTKALEQNLHIICIIIEHIYKSWEMKK